MEQARMYIRIPVSWVMLGIALVGVSPAFAADTQSPVDVWQSLLRPKYFPEREIIEDDAVIVLKTPYRSEDAAFTPVTITARFPQTPERYIQRIHVIVDNNPEPLAGTFDMTPALGRADLALRLRIDNYTNVRAIAVLNTGEHHMVVNFVKAQGGCSAPLGSDFAKAMERIGTMNFRTVGERNPDNTLVGQLMLSHPNVTGMQKDQKTQLIRPAHYVKTIRLYYNEQLIMTAETGISISEDPSFRFFFRPDEAGEFRADVVDSKGMEWSHLFKVDT
jgi:sulfur-oxidizing protein SoxY